MPAYVIFYVEKISDPAKLEQYKQNARPTFAGRNVARRVVYGRQSVVEGPPLEGVVMLEFPSYEEAESWYHSPEYQEVKKLRIPASTCHTVIVESV
jgi:uncharacterized protein (DUF1330 family)